MSTEGLNALQDLTRWWWSRQVMISVAQTWLSMLFVGTAFNALLFPTRAWQVSEGDQDSKQPFVFRLTHKAFCLCYKENMSACFVALCFREREGVRRGRFCDGLQWLRNGRGCSFARKLGHMFPLVRGRSSTCTSISDLFFEASQKLWCRNVPATDLKAAPNWGSAFLRQPIRGPCSGRSQRSCVTI